MEEVIFTVAVGWHFEIAPDVNRLGTQRSKEVRQQPEHIPTATTGYLSRPLLLTRRRSDRQPANTFTRILFFSSTTISARIRKQFRSVLFQFGSFHYVSTS